MTARKGKNSVLVGESWQGSKGGSGEGGNRCRKPSRAKHAVTVMEGEEAPASTGERKGCVGRVWERTDVSPEMSTDSCLSCCCEQYGLTIRSSRSETALFCTVSQCVVTQKQPFFYHQTLHCRVDLKCPPEPHG